MLGLSQLLITFYLLNHYGILAHPLSSGETLARRGFGGATSVSPGNHALRKRMEEVIAGGVQASEKGLGSGARVEELKGASSGLSARPEASVPIIEFPEEDTPHEPLPLVNPSVSGSPASGEPKVVELDPESLDKSAAVTPVHHSLQAGSNLPTPVPSTAVDPAPKLEEPKEITNKSSPKVNEPTIESTGVTQPTAVATTPKSQSGHEASVASSQTKDAKDGVNAQVEETPSGKGETVPVDSDAKNTQNSEKGDQDTNDNVKGSGSDSNSRNPEDSTGPDTESHQTAQLAAIERNEEVARRNSERDTEKKKEIDRIKQARRKARQQGNSNRIPEEGEANRKGQDSSPNQNKPKTNEEVEKIKIQRQEEEKLKRQQEEEERLRVQQQEEEKLNRQKEEEERLKVQQQEEENLKRKHEEEENMKTRQQEEEAERRRQASQKERERKKQFELENRRRENESKRKEEEERKKAEQVEAEKKRKEAEERKKAEQVEAEKKRLEALKIEQEKARQQQEAEGNKQSNVQRNSESPNDKSVHNESQKSGTEPHSEPHKKGDDGETPSNPSTPKGNGDDPALEEKFRDANKKFADDQPKRGFFHPVKTMFRSIVRRMKIAWNKLWRFVTRQKKSSVHPPEGESGAPLFKDVDFNPSDEPPNVKVAREAAQKGELPPPPAPPAEKQKEPFHNIPDRTAESK